MSICFLWMLPISASSSLTYNQNEIYIECCSQGRTLIYSANTDVNPQLLEKTEACPQRNTTTIPHILIATFFET